MAPSPNAATQPLIIKICTSDCFALDSLKKIVLHLLIKIPTINSIVNKKQKMQEGERV